MLDINQNKIASLLIVVLTCSTVFTSVNVAANNNEVRTTTSVTSAHFIQAQLAQMLAPIALYPDALLTHILISATYPIEVIGAERWLTNNQHLSEQALLAQSEQKDWDPSVKALLSFPKVLKQLSEDLQWMQNLGDAFLQDEAALLATVQALRTQADKAGNLAQMDKVNIVRSANTIIIEPAQPEVIYVPYYDTRVVYGTWHWSHYPPVYWHSPRYYRSSHNPYYWYNPVHISVGLLFGAVHWHNRHITVNYDRHYYNYYGRHTSVRKSTSHQSQRWQHNPRHRKGVAYRTTRLQSKYQSHAPSVEQSKYQRKQESIVHGKSKKHTVSKHKQVKQKLELNQAHKVKSTRFSKNKGELIEKNQQRRNGSSSQHKAVVGKANKIKQPAVKMNKHSKYTPSYNSSSHKPATKQVITKKKEKVVNKSDYYPTKTKQKNIRIESVKTNRVEHTKRVTKSSPQVKRSNENKERRSNKHH